MTKRKISPEKAERFETKNFFDCVLPGIVKFNVDHYIVGDGYRSVWAVREYPPLTEQQAILARIADKNGVTQGCTIDSWRQRNNEKSFRTPREKTR